MPHPDKLNKKGFWHKVYKNEDGVKSSTKSYTVWYGMCYRSTSNNKYQQRRPTYKDCYLSDNFKNYQYFVEWHRKQVGYNLKYHLDKDILFNGNKCYGEGQCVLIPQELNSFLTGSDSKRSKYPRGVHLNSTGKYFKVQIKAEGVVRYVGRYSNIEEAAQAYKKEKEAEAFRWYERLRAGEFVVDERVIERMKNWKFE